MRQHAFLDDPQQAEVHDHVAWWGADAVWYLLAVTDTNLVIESACGRQEAQR